MGSFVISSLFAACFALLGWALMRALQEGSDGYAEVYARETSQGFEDIFLFIPARRIADLARILAVIAFIFFFFVFGDFAAARGWITGFVFGIIGAAGALNLPRILLNFLKNTPSGKI